MNEKDDKNDDMFNGHGDEAKNSIWK